MVVAVLVRGCWRGVVEGVAGGCRCGGACWRMLERCGFSIWKRELKTHVFCPCYLVSMLVYFFCILQFSFSGDYDLI